LLLLVKTKIFGLEYRHNSNSCQPSGEKKIGVLE
jgi:hypothetical protein